MTRKRTRREVPGGRPASPPAGGPAGGLLELVETAWGAFPRIEALNPAFGPGSLKIKLTLRIRAGTGAPRAAEMLASLAGFLPALSRHRCCGENTLERTFFERGVRTGCALRETDEAVDVAHLVEHAAIDILHFVARMRTCSGVTCGWVSPEDLYDVFVECPEESLGRSCAGIALDLVGCLLQGSRPDPRYLCQIQAARLACDRAGRPLGPSLRGLERTWGPAAVAEAVASLERRGLLSECAASFNFSGGPLLGYAVREDPRRGSS
jgi:hypothetical protein